MVEKIKGKGKDGVDIAGTLIGIPGTLSIAGIVFIGAGILFLNDKNPAGWFLVIPGISLPIIEILGLKKKILELFELE